MPRAAPPITDAVSLSPAPTPIATTDSPSAPVQSASHAPARPQAEIVDGKCDGPDSDAPIVGQKACNEKKSSSEQLTRCG